MKQFKNITPIGDGNASAVPVKNVDRAIEFYKQVLGFSLVTRDQQSAVLQRDNVQVGLVAQADHDPLQAGSFYIAVVDVETLCREFLDKGAKPGPIHIQTHAGQRYRIFFLRECDIRESHDGYCFCFGQPA